jgi:hypothetical protein
LHQPPNSRIQADSWPSNNKKDFEKRVNRDWNCPNNRQNGFFNRNAQPCCWNELASISKIKQKKLKTFSQTDCYSQVHSAEETQWNQSINKCTIHHTFGFVPIWGGLTTSKDDEKRVYQTTAIAQIADITLSAMATTKLGQ